MNRYIVALLSFLIAWPSWSAIMIPSAPALDASAYILLDVDSGRVLVEKNADEQLPPASLTKMMTSYIAVHELMEGKVAEDTLVPISVKAWKKGGSKMFVREGTEVPMIDLLRGIIVHSGNDASTAVAEYFAGSEEAYAGWMNDYANRFGMVNTQFKNSTGWPEEGHYSSARDIAILAKHIVTDHPEYYSLYAEKYYEYNDIRQPNRNKLLWRDDSVDGLKTGHTDEAGYCLAASAKRENTRYVAVVMGTDSDAARTRETQKLLSYGFRYYETQKLYSAGDVLNTERVWFGVDKSIAMALESDMYLTLPKGSGNELEIDIITPEYIEAPIKQGQSIGTIKVNMGGELLAERPLLAVTDIDEGGFVGKLVEQVELFFERLM